MDPKKKLQLSYHKNIPRNLFPKTYSFTENKNYKNYSTKEIKKNVEIKPNSKPLKTTLYFPKISINESKKDKNIKQKSEIKIDSKTEARLPLGYIDLSFDNPKNE